jgi:multidrug efflux pump
VLSLFFIDRPIFARVLSILIMLIGAVALATLPIAQYPRITPPAVQVSISYPGANAQVVADTVGAPIEQQVTGVPGILYMSSQSGNDGSYSLQVTFDVNVDLNTAPVMVQNRVALAMPLLPTPVQNQGITIRKRTPDILLLINFISPDGRYDDLLVFTYWQFTHAQTGFIPQQDKGYLTSSRRSVSWSWWAWPARTRFSSSSSPSSARRKA